MKFADALHRLDTFPTVGHGKHKYVEVRHIFSFRCASASVTAQGVRVLAQFKAHGSLLSGEGSVDPTKLVPTQHGIYRKKVEKDIEEHRLSERIIVWCYRQKYYILDGHHRAATALLVGATELPATFLYSARPQPAGVV
jgi:hypothetical protein